MKRSRTIRNTLDDLFYHDDLVLDEYGGEVPSSWETNNNHGGHDDDEDDVYDDGQIGLYLDDEEDEENQPPTKFRKHELIDHSNNEQTREKADENTRNSFENSYGLGIIEDLNLFCSSLTSNSSSLPSEDYEEEEKETEPLKGPKQEETKTIDSQEEIISGFTNDLLLSPCALGSIANGNPLRRKTGVEEITVHLMNLFAGQSTFVVL